MGLFNTFDVAGSALSAQSLRLNLTASNLANMNNVAGSADEVYRARHAVFRSAEPTFADRLAAVGVRVLGVVESRAPAIERFDPGHPEADENGLVYAANVNAVEEMANMLSASRSYQSNLEVINTAKQLLLRTLSLGQG
jgi:flagellar basal-body rod protein FlgC